MPINAMDLQQYAKANCGPEVDETTLRSAASRAYYGAYHALLPFVEQLPVSDRGERGATTIGHREMLRRIQEWHTSGIHPKLASMAHSRNQLVLALRAMRETREAADYLLGASICRNDVIQQVQRGSKIQTIVLQVKDLLDSSLDDAAYG
ncbi:hypothetical protein [Stenotrophomonas muris]|uniref:hypothetical protein n=1 Tax=Stenotrophomonas muris TaxID=2963283 RepID=UPI00383BD4F2